MKTYMAIDQHGCTYHGLTHPRKDLMERLGRKRATKAYIDTVNGEAQHCGYKIAGYWWRMYEVKPFERRQP
jgi:hypothetical protein